MFKYIIRPPLFRLSAADPEAAHALVMRPLALAAHHPLLLKALAMVYGYQNPVLARTVCGIRFPNPVGLAGGFDKNGRALSALAALGFGFIEAGGVTRYAQPGQPRPRIFRLPEDAALINRMGLPNDGADAIAARLAKQPHPPVPIGWQIAKSKVTPLEEAAADCCYTLRALYPYGDYFTVNVSSPNTPGLRRLQEPELLANLLRALVADARLLAAGHVPKPMFVKLAPDLTTQALDETLAICLASGISGIIATNTTTQRVSLRSGHQHTEGGLSGRPLAARALEVVRYLCQRLDSTLPVIGVGGIMEPDDAKRMLDAGAALIQIYTGFIYGGPAIVKRINQSLVSREKII